MAGDSGAGEGSQKLLRRQKSGAARLAPAGVSRASPRSRQAPGAGSGAGGAPNSPIVASPSRRRSPAGLAVSSPSSSSPRTRLQLGKVVPTVRQLVMEDMARKGLDGVVSAVGTRAGSRMAREGSLAAPASPGMKLRALSAGGGSTGGSGAEDGLGAGAARVGGRAEGVETGSSLVQGLPADAPVSSKGDGVLRRVLLRMGYADAPSHTSVDDGGESDDDDDEEGVKDIEDGEELEEEGVEEGRARRNVPAAAALVPVLGREDVRVRESLLLLRERSTGRMKGVAVAARQQSVPLPPGQQQQQEQRQQAQVQQQEEQQEQQVDEEEQLQHDMQQQEGLTVQHEARQMEVEVESEEDEEGALEAPASALGGAERAAGAPALSTAPAISASGKQNLGVVHRVLLL